MQAVRVDLATGRHYECNKGKIYPSVTTVLRKTQNPGQQYGLRKWIQKVGEEEAEKIKIAAAHRGTLTHAHAEKYLVEGIDEGCHEDALPYWKSIKCFANQIEEVRMMEASVFHHGLRYAGTVDLLAVHKGSLTLVDWKTSDKPKKYVSALYDYPLQLAAYIGAINKQHEEHGILVKRATLVVGIPNMEAEVFEFDADAILKYWKEWIVRLHNFNALPFVKN